MIIFRSESEFCTKLLESNFDKYVDLCAIKGVEIIQYCFFSALIVILILALIGLVKSGRDND